MVFFWIIFCLMAVFCMVFLVTLFMDWLSEWPGSCGEKQVSSREFQRIVKNLESVDLFKLVLDLDGKIEKKQVDLISAIRNDRSGSSIANLSKTIRELKENRDSIRKVLKKRGAEYP